jgi:hypothetical protein
MFVQISVWCILDCVIYQEKKSDTTNVLNINFKNMFVFVV